MKNNRINRFVLGIEKYQTLIGILLIISILVASAIIMVINFQSEKNNDNSNDLAQKVESLEIEQKNINDKINQIIDSLNQNKISQTSTVAEVKGVSTEKTSSKSSAQQVSGIVNINTASLSQLDSLSGIGPTYAQRIIDYRIQNGGFKSIEEIKNVKGIGDKTFEKFKDQIII